MLSIHSQKKPDGAASAVRCCQKRLDLPRSTIQIEPTELADTVQRLGLFGIRVVGSADGDGVVTLIVQGDIVPDARQVAVEWSIMTGSIYGQITVRCEVVD